MYLSDTELKEALDEKRLIVDPYPPGIDPTSIDLHLDAVEEAKIWNMETFGKEERMRGNQRAELRIGQYNFSDFSSRFLRSPPEYDDTSEDLVQRRGNQICLRPHGFVLWQTQEFVGTDPENAELMCFIDGKSTRARAGILVHLTAPTVHATWGGKLTLEIVNLGPFDLVLQQGDVIAQLTVAQITSPPKKTMAKSSVTYRQRSVNGSRDS